MKHNSLKRNISHQGLRRLASARLIIRLLLAVLAVAWFSSTSHAAGRVVAWGSDEYGETDVPAGLSNVIALAGGEKHALALRSDGTVVAWGDNAIGQSTVPAGLASVAAIASGSIHSLALRSNGTVVAWGKDPEDRSGRADVPAGLSGITAVAAGQLHSVALRSDGTVVVWGDNGSRQRNVPSDLTNAVAIAAGLFHTLVLRANGTVVAWGGDPAVSTVPPGLNDIVAISAGGGHNLALKSDGSLVAWGGYNPDVTAIPAGLSNVVAISAQGGHNLALRTDGAVVAWGFSGQGQTSVPPTLNSVSAIGGGSAFSMAVAGGGAPVTAGPILPRTAFSGESVQLLARVTSAAPLFYQWQFNGVDLPHATNHTLRLVDLQPGHAGTYSLTASNAMGSITQATQLSVLLSPPVLLTQPVTQTNNVGQTVEFEVVAVGSLPILSYQWRFNGFDIPDATNSLLRLANLKSDHAGLYSIRVSNAFGTVTSSNAQLIVSPVIAWYRSSRFVVDPLPGVTNIVAVGVGGGEFGQGPYELALRTDGTVSASGFAPPLMPVGLNSIAAISAGYDHCLALRSNGTVVSWGYSSFVPAGLSDVKSIAAGLQNSLALKSNGTIVVWGNLNPPPAGLTNVIAISSGGFSDSAVGSCALALKGDGTVVAWGSGFGPSVPATNVPPTLKTVVAISAGYGHCLALKGDGSVVAWGQNAFGLTNVPAGLRDVVAVAAGYQHSAALKSDGTVVEWGAFDPAPLSLHNVTALSTWSHTLAMLGDGTPVFANFLASRVAFSGREVTLNAGAVGAGALTYQWFWNGAAVEGATNAFLPLGNVHSGQSGAYSVTVSNSLGAATQSGTLSVVDSPPFIITQPRDVNSPPGTSATFRVEADGVLPLHYQWRLNGSELPGETNSIFQLSNVQESQFGSYDVVITNAHGAVTSSTAVLQFLVPPVITQGLRPVTAIAGDNVTFTVTVTNTAALPISYRWTRGATSTLTNIILNSRTSSFTVFNVTTNASSFANGPGPYSVVVTNIATVGSGFRSGPALLTVLPATAPTATTLAASNPSSSSATLNANVNPMGAQTVAWFDYGLTAAYGSRTTATNVGNASNLVAFSQAVSGLMPGTNYHYRVVATNYGGTALGADMAFQTPSSMTPTNPGVFPIGSQPYGMTYAKWAEKYWQWSMSFPATANPAADSAPASSSQSGPVWFLPSVTGNRTVTRQIIIPAGTALFFPVLSVFYNNADCPTNTTDPVEVMLANANGNWDARASITRCTIDGVPVQGLESPQQTPYRLATDRFFVTVADHDNLIAATGTPCFPDGGTIDMVSVGAFLMLRPLSVGQHTVRIVGAAGPVENPIFVKDATYQITVSPTVYSTGFEPPTYQPDVALVGQDGWVAPPPLSPNAAFVTRDLPFTGLQSVRVFGSNLVHQDFIVEATAGLFDAIGSYRRPVNYDTHKVETLRVSARVRIDGPRSADGDHFFSASLAARGGSESGGAGVGELAISSDGHAYAYTGNEDVPIFRASTPIQLGRWHELAVVANFATETSTFYVDDVLLTTFHFDTNEVYTGVLLRGAILAYAAPDTATNKKADYTAHYDNFAIEVLTPVERPTIRTYARGVDGRMRLQFDGVAGRTYTVLTSENLKNWTVGPPATETSPGHYEFTDATAPTPATRFYRLRSP